MPKSKTSLSELLHEVRRIEEHREVLTNKKIRAIYKSLMDDLDASLAKGFKQYADGDGRLFLSYLDAKNKRAKFLEEIIANVDHISPQLQKEMLDLVERTYAESYKGFAEAVKKADAEGKLAEATKDISVRPEVLKQAVNNNISKLTLPYVLEKNRNELIYQIQQVLNIGLMNGDRYEKMARQISERCEVAMSKAENITRTETHRNIEAGFMDCAESVQEGLDGSGMILASRWRNMNDEKVRPQRRYRTKKGWKTSLSTNGANHVKMEGVIVKAGESFKLEPDVFAKCPGCSGVARHDCRCRCFLEYVLMTAEEFAKATGQSVPQKKREAPNTEYMRPEDLTEKEAAVFDEIEATYEQLYQKYGVKVDLLGDKIAVEQRDWDRALDFSVGEYLKEHPKVGRKRAETYVKKSMYPRPEKADMFLGGEYWDDAPIVNENGGFGRIKKITVNKFEMGFDKSFKEGEEYIISKLAKREERIKRGRRARGLSNATEGGTGTLLHEYGHALDYAKGVRDHPKFKKWYSTLSEDEITNGLSSYAATNEKEFIAEAFAESFYSYQRPMSKKFMEILEEILND